jgi:hypothetical protein
VSEKPKAGEWWVKEGNGSVVFIVGYDPDENVVFVDENGVFDCCDEEWLSSAGMGYQHVPECKGFDWKKEQPLRELDLVEAIRRLSENIDRLEKRVAFLEITERRERACVAG